MKCPHWEGEKAWMLGSLGVGELEVMNEDFESFSLLFGIQNPLSLHQSISFHSCFPWKLLIALSLAMLVKACDSLLLWLKTWREVSWAGQAAFTVLWFPFIQTPELSWRLLWPLAGVSILLISTFREGRALPRIIEGREWDGPGGPLPDCFLSISFCLVPGWDSEMKYQLLVLSTEKRKWQGQGDKLSTLKTMSGILFVFQDTW